VQEEKLPFNNPLIDELTEQVPDMPDRYINISVEFKSSLDLSQGWINIVKPFIVDWKGQDHNDILLCVEHDFPLVMMHLRYLKIS